MRYEHLKELYSLQKRVTFVEQSISIVIVLGILEMVYEFHLNGNVGKLFSQITPRRNIQSMSRVVLFQISVRSLIDTRTTNWWVQVELRTT